jgi:serine/threonine-protein phosphatase 6 regulatory ankyrin repeat subunit B
MATTQTLNHGANANLETELGETALHIVSRGEYYPQEQGVSTARLLLERGADVNARQNNGWTSLHWAAYKGRVEVAQVLLDHGANAKLKTTLGETVLHLVSRGEYYSQDHGAGITRLLLEHGVDLDVQNKFLDTALHWAADKGRLEITQLLLDHGANPNLASERGLRPLDIVVSNGQYNSQERAVDIAQLLLERGVDVNAPQKNGWTALHWAAFSGNVKAAQLLLDHGANANLETDKGETALHIVSQGEYDSQEQGVSTALLLLEHGVDVNARRKDGWTALHWAAYKGRVEVAQVLLDNGVNAKVEDREVKRRRTS